MIAALVLAAAPFADAFWQRDLGALSRALQEDAAPGEEHELFDDLLRLATCAPLEKLQQISPMRSLARAEEARRGTPGTIWDDLLRADFFRRKVQNPSPRKALIWPAEQERWPDEVLVVDEPPFRCKGAARGTGALDLLTPELVRSLPPQFAARASYERAVLLFRKGSLDGPAVQAIDLAQLDAELQPSARFLRLEKGFDPPEGWVRLAAEWPAGQDDLALRARAATELYRQREHRALTELTAGALQLSPKTAERAALVRHLLLLRALSLHVLGDDRAMIDAMAAAFALPGPERGLEPFRALAIDALAQRGFDPDLLGRFARPLQPALEQLALRAIDAGNLGAARAAAARLGNEADPRWRAASLAIYGRAAWEAGELPGVRDAFARLFSSARRDVLRAPERDAAALQLAQALVVSDVQHPEPRLHGALLAQLDGLRIRIGLRSVPDVEALLAALREAQPERGERPVALGSVDVALAPEPPPAPPVAIDLPEPRSLLAIPMPDESSLRDWFDTRGAP